MFGVNVPVVVGATFPIVDCGMTSSSETSPPALPLLVWGGANKLEYTEVTSRAADSKVWSQSPVSVYLSVCHHELYLKLPPCPCGHCAPLCVKQIVSGRL